MDELFVGLWAICLLVVPLIAVKKNKGGIFWFFLALLFGPFSLLMIAAASSEPPDTSHGGGFIRKCPFCAEGIKKDAVICRHCGKDLPPEAEAE